MTRRADPGGRVQVYTGDGKGKTTAALGLALRAAGWGERTFIGQFMKGQVYGELRAVRRLLGGLVTIEQYGGKRFLHLAAGDPPAADVARARRGLLRCRRAMLSGAYRIVVLDEANVAVYFKLLAEEDVLGLLDERPPGVELVLTGRRAPRSFLRRADLVTDMREVKHYFRSGVPARRGIER